MRTLSTAQTETVEAEFMLGYVGGAPARDQETLGIATRRIGGGVVLSARHDPTRYWSKALGFGFAEPVSGYLIDRVLDVYRSEGNPGAGLQVSPEVLPDDWAEIVRTRGLEPAGEILKLAAPIEDVIDATAPDGLRIAPVGKEDADMWAEAVLDGFGMPHEGLAGMIAATVGHPQFFPYAAWDGDAVVGGGNLFVHGPIASLNAGSMKPGQRRRGGQTALIAARVRRARELGCRWVVTETGNPAEGESNPSTNNMLRAGLKPLYVRRNYVWRA
jgi:hypothetical protein